MKKEYSEEFIINTENKTNFNNLNILNKKEQMFSSFDVINEKKLKNVKINFYFSIYSHSHIPYIIFKSYNLIVLP